MQLDPQVAGNSRASRGLHGCMVSSEQELEANQDLLHQTLKSGRSNAKPKWHHLKLP